MLINSARGLVKSMGSRLPPCHSEYFANKVESAIPKELKEALQPLLELSVSVSASIQLSSQA
jgi:hypothetical protein